MFRPLCVLMNRRSCSSRGDRATPAAAGTSGRTRAPLRLDDLLHSVHAGGANELVLEILDADVEAEPLHVGPRETGAEPGALERATEHRLLTGVDEAREPTSSPCGPYRSRKAPMACAPPIGTTATRSSGRLRPRRRASASTARWSLTPSTRTTVETSDGAVTSGPVRAHALNGDAGVLEQAAVCGVRVGMLEDLERLLRVDDELEGLSAVVDDGDGERVVLGVPDEVYVDSLVRAVRQLAAAH